MRTEPVADTSGRSRDAANAWPTSGPSPITRFTTPRGTSGISASTLCTMPWHAIAESGVFSEGFQTTGSPQTKAIIAFHDQTATGKLNAVMTPTGPSGCHSSARRCRGRSLTIERP